MLKQADTQVLSALATLQGNPQFETVKSWLRESLQDLHVTTASTKDEVLTRWNQGAAQAVAELLDKAENATTVLRKSR